MFVYGGKELKCYILDLITRIQSKYSSLETIYCTVHIMDSMLTASVTYNTTIS
jgi:hypothetical protein